MILKPAAHRTSVHGGGKPVERALHAFYQFQALVFGEVRA